jgi:hypothetical protein
MKVSLTVLLMEEVKPSKVDLKHATEITMHQFVDDVLPTAKSIELLVDNSMTGNFVSLTAPEHTDCQPLFRWANNFAWSYDGNVADSLKQRVKRAGGNVDAKVRTSLGWYNTDDLDLHVIEPNGNHICYYNKCDKLDVDMNVFSPVRNAVENVCWTGRMLDGTYQVIVNNYNRRESVDVGFELELAVGDHTRMFSYIKPVSKDVLVLTFEVKRDQVVDVKLAADVIEGASGQEKWGIRTEELTPVDSLMLSPNFWDDNAVGNKHWLFMLHGCRNPLPTRGIYNEFLHPSLEPHRKVFEILGDKLKCQVTDEQLSGIGFSSTRKDQVKVVVRTGSSARAYHITF